MAESTKLAPLYATVPEDLIEDLKRLAVVTQATDQPQTVDDFVREALRAYIRTRYREIQAELSLDDVLRVLAADPAADEAALHESALLSESAIAAIWDTPEEDEAWRDL